jgi:para-aminobenzoate synthetase component 1
VLRCDGRSHFTTLTGTHFAARQWSEPLAALRWVADSLAELPAKARWIGYLSYELGRLFETIPATATDDLALPLFVFTLHEPGENCEIRGHQPLSNSSLHSNFTRSAYEAAVRRAIDYIAAGDIFQVNLSQRFSVGLRRQPADIYDRLRERSPSLYGALLDYGDHALVSNSPELFLSVKRQSDGSRRVVTRPIKGTRPRLPGLEIELRDSMKDQAELNMIVDLERNDLGRVCRIGSVKVSQPRVIEAHPTVYHGVATIEGILRDDVSFVDLLWATFPGGSITGAPKIRAMQIIEQLESTRRGPYCGAIGYLAANGEMEFNMAIRTIVVKDGLAHISVGGGVVADSDPAAEYDETLVKAQAMFAALGVESPA